MKKLTVAIFETGSPAEARDSERRPFFAKASKGKTGRSIPVVRLFWEQIDRVRFSAPRQVKLSGLARRSFSEGGIS